MKTYILEVKFKTTKQMLKGFNILYLNRGYLPKITLNDYEKKIIIEVVHQKFRIEEFINLLKKKKIINKGMTLTTITKDKEIEVIKWTTKNKH